MARGAFLLFVSIVIFVIIFIAEVLIAAAVRENTAEKIIEPYCNYYGADDENNSSYGLAAEYQNGY